MFVPSVHQQTKSLLRLGFFYFYMAEGIFTQEPIEDILAYIDPSRERENDTDSPENFDGSRSPELGGDPEHEQIPEQEPGEKSLEAQKMPEDSEDDESLTEKMREVAMNGQGESENWKKLYDSADQPEHQHYFDGKDIIHANGTNITKEIQETNTPEQIAKDQDFRRKLDEHPDEIIKTDEREEMIDGVNCMVVRVAKLNSDKSIRYMTFACSREEKKKDEPPEDELKTDDEENEKSEPLDDTDGQPQPIAPEPGFWDTPAPEPEVATAQQEKQEETDVENDDFEGEIEAQNKVVSATELPKADVAEPIIISPEVIQMSELRQTPENLPVETPATEQVQVEVAALPEIPTVIETVNTQIDVPTVNTESGAALIQDGPVEQNVEQSQIIGSIETPVVVATIEQPIIIEQSIGLEEKPQVTEEAVSTPVEMTEMQEDTETEILETTGNHEVTTAGIQSESLLQEIQTPEVEAQQVPEKNQVVQETQTELPRVEVPDAVAESVATVPEVVTQPIVIQQTEKAPERTRTEEAVAETPARETEVRGGQLPVEKVVAEETAPEVSALAETETVAVQKETAEPEKTTEEVTAHVVVPEKQVFIESVVAPEQAIVKEEKDEATTTVETKQPEHIIEPIQAPVEKNNFVEEKNEVVDEMPKIAVKKEAVPMEIYVPAAEIKSESVESTVEVGVATVVEEQSIKEEPVVLANDSEIAQPQTETNRTEEKQIEVPNTVVESVAVAPETVVPEEIAEPAVIAQTENTPEAVVTEEIPVAEKPVAEEPLTVEKAKTIVAEPEVSALAEVAVPNEKITPVEISTLITNNEKHVAEITETPTIVVEQPVQELQKPEEKEDVKDIVIEEKEQVVVPEVREEPEVQETVPSEMTTAEVPNSTPKQETAPVEMTGRLEAEDKEQETAEEVEDGPLVKEEAVLRTLRAPQKMPQFRVIEGGQSRSASSQVSDTQNNQSEKAAESSPARSSLNGITLRRKVA